MNLIAVYVISHRGIKVLKGFQDYKVLMASLVQEGPLAFLALRGPQFLLEGPL